MNRSTRFSPSVRSSSCVCWNSWHIFLFLLTFNAVCWLPFAFCIEMWSSFLAVFGWLDFFPCSENVYLSLHLCIILLFHSRSPSLFFISQWVCAPPFILFRTFFLSHSHRISRHTLLSLFICACFAWRKIYASFPVDLAMLCIFIGISTECALQLHLKCTLTEKKIENGSTAIWLQIENNGLVARWKAIVE